MNWSMSDTDKFYLLTSAPDSFVDIDLDVRLVRSGAIERDGTLYKAVFAVPEAVTFVIPSASLMRCMRFDEADQCSRLD